VSGQTPAFSKICFHCASNKRGKTEFRVEAKMSGIKQMTVTDYSPEKAGGGGSIPSLATIPSVTAWSRV